MRRHFMFATVLAAAMSVGASAQSGTGQTGTAGQGSTTGQSEPNRSPEKQAKDKNENVTVTGCIQSANQSGSTAAKSGSSASAGSAGGSATSGSDTMGTSGSASNASRAAGTQFVLTNVTGAPAPLSGVDHLSLSGKEKDLQKHVGQKVEITGKLENPKAGGSSSYGSPAGATGTSGTSAGAGTLKVSSIKKVADSCTVQ